MKIREIIRTIEQFAPLSYQEFYDNAGLLTGDSDWEVKNVLLTLDATEPVVEEAIERGCNLIIAHHPIVFGGLKKLNGKNYVERTVIKAIKNDIAIYAAHTNLDNVKMGVNAMICDRLGIHNRKILSPKKGLLNKLYTFVPHEKAEQVKSSLFEAGAGHIGNYSESGFSVKGEGSFKAGAGTHPYVGEKGKRHVEQETKIEVIFPAIKKDRIITALKQAHPYEEVAYDILQLENTYDQVGSGMMGVLENPMEEMDFLQKIKMKMKAGGIRYTPLRGKKVKKVAVCGGAGSFLLKKAIGAGADLFITADFKYHEFFDADNQIVIADIGHFESEQFTVEIFNRIIQEKFPTFAPLKSNIRTNPINYLH
ncbi:MAG TPA: Nif3-like dinuclear metal center hexameric protein [Chitinophagaceae bacterium]|nr:Nif3-like dinuclear metal center hexameric protein [Chitinophagaceae bacterium]